MCDDMGSGRTIEVIGHIINQKLQGRRGATLVVMPLRLIDDWKDTILNDLQPGTLSVIVYHDNGRVNAKTGNV